MQTGSVTNPTDLVVIIGGMALLFLGLMRFVSGFLKSNEARRSEIFSELEKTKIQNAELQAKLMIAEDKINETTLDLTRYKTLYKSKVNENAVRKVDTAELDALVEIQSDDGV